MSKETASFSKKTERQMAERVLNFLSALKKPTMRIGEKRAKRKPNPDFVAPEPVQVERFEQLDREDRWSRTEYKEGDYGSGQASIVVQDPQDPDDLVCARVGKDRPSKHRVKGNEELREFHEEKISQLNIPDVEDNEV